MALADRFGFFDPTQPFTVTYGELPHWEQEGRPTSLRLDSLIRCLPLSANSRSDNETTGYDDMVSILNARIGNPRCGNSPMTFNERFIGSTQLCLRQH